MKMYDDIVVWGDPVDAHALEQIQRSRRTADYAAMMGDHHPGYAVPIGGVVAYRNKISPSGVGFDIACGNKAVLTDMPGSAARADIDSIMDSIWKTLEFGIGTRNREPVDHALFDDPAWSCTPVTGLKKLASDQMGTIGSGNHYVDLFTDEQDRVWIGVHFGSRGLGYKTAEWFLKQSGAKDSMDAVPAVIECNSTLGEEYIT